MNQATEKKDFLVEIAKGVELLDTAGVRHSGMTVEYTLTAMEYHALCTELKSRGVITSKPDNQLSLSMSGVMVTFKSQ
jgi:hypothetical protein